MAKAILGPAIQMVSNLSQGFVNAVWSAAPTFNPKNTPVDQDYQFKGSPTRLLNMIDNYIYFYHTDTLLAIPVYPESIADNMAITYNPTSPLSSTAPTQSFQNSGPRSFDISIPLHRDMMSAINSTQSKLKNKIPELIEMSDDGKTERVNVDYIDILIKQIQGAALPNFKAAEKMVNPPVVAVRFGNDIFCKGVVTGGVSVTYGIPILEDGRYANVTIAFSIAEITPFDAESAMQLGGFRGYDLQEII